NYPVYLVVGKLSQAVVTGNAFILKPSPFTPYSGLKLAELAQRFFPPGVVQALAGDDSLGPLLTAHPGVDKVSFTGSTATGRLVAQSCAQTFKRMTLELGGNDAAIVCPDVDPEVVGPKLALVALANSGQICSAIKRVYVHESIYKAVMSSMVQFIDSLKIGDGFGDGVSLGPLTNRLQFDRVRELLSDIEAKGFKLATGSTRPLVTAGKGFFISPTLVENPPGDSRIVVEEPFVPVFPVLKWSDEAEVIDRANHTDMGLGASIWIQDLDRADRISKSLKAGNIWINIHGELQFNAPFAGHKSSGFGAANGIDGLKAYCSPQTVYVTKLS
ncbi:betaine aldehyde dehydrogenase, partial [Xylariales sp. PMI_506]